jgi:hypothetical protein
MARNLARAMGTRSAEISRGLATVESGIGTLSASRLSLATCHSMARVLARLWRSRRAPMADSRSNRTDRRTAGQGSAGK